MKLDWTNRQRLELLVKAVRAVADDMEKAFFVEYPADRTDGPAFGKLIGWFTYQLRHKISWYRRQRSRREAGMSHES